MISATCDRGHVSSAAANAVAVHSMTTSAGTVRVVLSQCDQCPDTALVQTFVTEFEAHAIGALVQGRRAIAELRLKHAIDGRRN